MSDTSMQRGVERAHARFADVRPEVFDMTDAELERALDEAEAALFRSGPVTENVFARAAEASRELTRRGVQP